MILDTSLRKVHAMDTVARAKLRPAEPAIEEGQAFAGYLDQAAEGFFGFWLGGRADSILAQAYLQPGHDLSYEGVTFAERDGALVGMALGYTAEQHRLSSTEPLEQAAGRWHPRMSTVSFVLAPLFKILHTMADGDFYLQAIAVDPAERGTGVGSALMDFAEENAIASGAARLVLDVSVANATARRLYERRGMTIESTWPRRFRLPKVTLLRMVKSL
jgi:ribosomal protein S18 acetylase RimI-like enzyme